MMIYELSHVLLWFIGALLSVFGGHLLVIHYVRKMRIHIGVEPNSQKLTAELGMIERLIYAVTYATQNYEVLYFWLGLKIVQKLIRYKVNDIGEVIKLGERINVYLIGNFLSLVSALVSVEIIKLMISFIQGVNVTLNFDIASNHTLVSSLSILLMMGGTFFLAKGFWPPTYKFSVTKIRTTEGGQLVQETPLMDTTGLIPEAELPEEMREGGNLHFDDRDRLLYRRLLKQSEDTVKIKSNGCIGAGMLLLGSILALVVLFM